MKILLMKVLMKIRKMVFRKNKKDDRMGFFFQKFLIFSIINQLMIILKQGLKKKDPLLKLQKEIKMLFFTKNIAFKK